MERQLQSMLITCDGDAKCGKTTIIESIASESMYQKGFISERAESAFAQKLLSIEDVAVFKHLAAPHTFAGVETKSAGNFYRGFAYLSNERRHDRAPITTFTDKHASELTELLKEPLFREFIQNDDQVKLQVSITAQVPGVHRLCGELFADDVLSVYQANGEANLVIVDARNPVALLGRNGAIGSRSDQIDPASIIPIYIDTPAEDAAAREVAKKLRKGQPADYATELAIIAKRRADDANRAELPVRRPDNLEPSHELWQSQFATPTSEVARPWLMRNDNTIDLENIQYTAGHLAQLARFVGGQLYERAKAAA